MFFRYSEYKIFIHQKFTEGQYIDGVRYFKHPGYKDESLVKSAFDIGLIEMSQSFEIDTGRNYKANFICLPPRNYRMPIPSLGMISGWGGDFGLSIGERSLQKRYQRTRQNNTLFLYLWHGQFEQIEMCNVIFS